MHQSHKEQWLQVTASGLLQPERREADAFAGLEGETDIVMLPAERKRLVPSSGGHARFA